MTRPRVAVVGFWHETNEYSKRLATVDRWREYELLTGEAISHAHAGTRSVIGGFLDALGDQAVPVYSAGAWPAGPTSAADLEAMLADMTAHLTAQGPFDAVALNLHGAMVAEGVPDVEVEVVARIREIVGDVPVAAVLDLHGNPSLELARSVDALVSYQTYPHVDMWECGQTAVELVERALAGDALSTSIAKLPILTCPLAQATDGPIGTVLNDMIATAPARHVLRASVMAGFAYQDVERAGMSVLAVSKIEDRAAAEQLVNDTAQRLVDAHAAGDFVVARPGAAEAVERALAADATPTVLVDIADNIGAGSAGDGTVILAELLRQQVRDAVVVVADAEVAWQSRDAGVGARLHIELGGKTDDLHGQPLPVAAVVRRVSDGRYTTVGSWGTGQTFDMGVTAVLTIEGGTVVVTERATPPFHREHLTSVGIDPGTARILVAKGAVAWRSAYGDDARTVIEVDAPGACPIDPWTLPRRYRPTSLLPARTPRATSRS